MKIMKVKTEDVGKSDIESAVQKVRERLLDQTMRNRFLNFLPTQRRTIKVINEIPAEVFEILVLQERVMQFKPSETPEREGTSLFDDEEDEETPVLPWLESTEPEEHHTDRFLQTQLAREELQKRLYYIHQQARTVFQEQGYSVLHLALGFLQWTESPRAEQLNRAPLMLIPVELERQKVRTRFTLRWNGVEGFPNLSLQARLTEYGVTLPILEAPEDKEQVESYFQEVNEAISQHEKWRVVPELYLDFFSFTKFVMYKDLEPENWDIETHPLLGTILGQTTGDSHANGFKPEEVDFRLKSQEIYHVMDADSSQIAVIEDIKSGKNLVVEGPPGTGKSQTITNIIAELLAKGKNVLFVSAKMAALEVVKSRLDKVGLGDFCLELHSHKSNKRDVLKELERTLSTQVPPDELPEALWNLFSQTDSRKNALNAYVNAIREPIGETGKNPYTLFGVREAVNQYFESVNRQMLPISLTDVTTCTRADWDTAVERLEALAGILPSVRPVLEHPWRGCNPGVVTPLVEVRINALIEACKTALDTLEEEISTLTDVAGIRTPTTLADFPDVLKAAHVIAKSFSVEAEILLNPAWNFPNKEARTLIRKVRVVRQEVAAVKARFNDVVLVRDIPKLLIDFKGLYIKKLRILNSQYRSIHRNFRKWYLTGNAPRRPERLISDYSKLADCIYLRQEIARQEQIGKSLFGGHWCGEESDLEWLTAFSEWVVTFRQHLLADVLTERAIEIVSAGVSKKHLQAHITALQSAQNDFVMQRDALFKRLGADADTLFGKASEALTFAELRARLELWVDKSSELEPWTQYVTRRNACEETIAQPLLKQIDEISIEDFVHCFEGNLAEALLHEAILERQPLRDFVQVEHERQVLDFCRWDRLCIEENQARLIRTLYERRPAFEEVASPKSEMGILQKEFTLKRRHRPIRRLLSDAGGLIQKIKPCFMMSPLSVAQFCHPDMVKFDVIVFDEASQIRPEDALGALLRAKQAVVIGDTCQLPPTSFFEHIVDNDDVDEDDMMPRITDIESILELCKPNFPKKALKWHYRSRHESLIAFSNQQFYVNELLIFPSPKASVPHLGLEFVHLPDTVYERGRSSVNRKEAQAVVQAAFEHYRTYGAGKSLGIGTFGTKQQQAILDEVEIQLLQHPEMEEYFLSSRDEHFFVKNLETIQGDERDTIFISVGYGFDKSRRLHNNFGPINHEGGERRLNVLITRARESCAVFANFRARDMKLDDKASVGARSLQAFLEYAENRNLDIARPTGEDTDSPFEDAVYEFLTSHGYTVSKQVGVVGYRIDLAVEDADALGAYLIGIECDGARYHNSPVARDRDRLRQQVLEGLGWTFHRIWSTDWYRNRAEAQRRVLEAIECAKLNKTTAPKQPVASAKKEPIPVMPEESVNRTAPALSPKGLDYVEATELGIPVHGGLHMQSPSQLAQAIKSVVQLESPVHFDEVVLRIRSLWGLKRTGERIRDAIKKGVTNAKQSGAIRDEDGFLWWGDEEQDIPVRRRTKPRIERICNAEIREAMKMTITSQGAIFEDALITESAKLLGYKSTRSQVSERMAQLLAQLINEGIFQKSANGMINLP